MGKEYNIKTSKMDKSKGYVPNYQSQQAMGCITEELNLGNRKSELRGKTIKIKKLVKKDDGHYSFRDSTIISPNEVSTDEIGTNDVLKQDFNLNSELEKLDQNVIALLLYYNIIRHSKSSPKLHHTTLK